MVFVLTHEYSDKSGFTVCGVTRVYEVARAWYNANDQTNVYAVDEMKPPCDWQQGIKSWKETPG